MGIRKKHRRLITVGEREYYWYVTEDVEDFPDSMSSNMLALNVLTEDKRFIVRFHLGQEDSALRHIIVIGPEFGGTSTSGRWRRFRSPRWGSGNRITPKHVRALIDWCMATDEERIEVDFRGDAMREGC